MITLTLSNAPRRDVHVDPQTISSVADLASYPGMHYSARTKITLHGGVTYEVHETSSDVLELIRKAKPH